MFFFFRLIFGSVGLLCFVVVVVLCEGGEGGVGPFKILRKHLRKEGKGASAGRVEGGGDPAECVAAVPGVDDAGQWVYSISAKPKMSVHTPAKGEVTYKAVKAWKDSGQGRPGSVSIEIRKDGQLQQTVALSAENNWMYTWKSVDDGSVWTVNETNVPEGYTVGIQRSGDTFSITNTKPATPAGNHPQTGDTTNTTLYVVLMAASGLALLVLGIVLRKKSRAK